MSEQTSDRARSRWDQSYDTDHATQEQVRNIYTLASELYWELYGDQRLSNSGSESGWLSWMRREYGVPRPEHVLELGSGNGDLLLNLQRKDFADRYTGIDLSDSAVRVAREKASREGNGRITFIQGDLNELRLESCSYDLIVAQMCIHHLENLEGVFDQVGQALRPGGVFVINDYVGPTRWQFPLMQLLLANVILWLLPRRLRVSYPDGKLKRGVRRPSIEDMIAMDPSEAVRSEEILSLFEQHFVVEHLIDYGGTISILVLDNIISNFRREDPQSLRWFKRILTADHWARQLGIVPVINVVLSGRPRDRC